jgi:hypothetical protein
VERKRPTSFRFSEVDEAILATLESATGVTRIDVIRVALRQLARALDVKLPVETPTEEGGEEKPKGRGKRK